MVCVQLVVMCVPLEYSTSDVCTLMMYEQLVRCCVRTANSDVCTGGSVGCSGINCL